MLTKFWIFQANPKYSQILEAIQKLDGIFGLVIRYHEEISLRAFISPVTKLQ
jgi:hypothetical protein